MKENPRNSIIIIKIRRYDLWNLWYVLNAVMSFGYLRERIARVIAREMYIEPESAEKCIETTRVVANRIKQKLDESPVLDLT